jgi:putative FmdB family regulatory protein
MPIYEYRCRACGTTFDTLVRKGDNVACPDCGGLSLHKLPSAPAILSGNAPRPSGLTCCGQDERCDAPPCSDSGGCRRP